MTDQLEINDPILVHDDSHELEGIVAYKGAVDFASGEDWIGVRLTGASAKLGQHDGSVDGREYFSCPPSSGLFVRVEAVTKRHLNRLEELRLKRELAGGTKTTAAPAARASTGSSISPAAVPKAPTTATPKKALEPTTGEKGDIVPSAPGTGTKGTISKLEELRRRRAALKDKELAKSALSRPSAEKATPLPAAATPLQADPTLSISSPAAALQEEEITKLKKELEAITLALKVNQGRLADKENETTSLLAKLASTEHELESVKEKVGQIVAADAKKAETKDLDDRASKLETLLYATDKELQETKVQLEQAKSARPQVVVSKALQGDEERLSTLQSAVDEWKATAQEAISEVTNLKRYLEQEKQAHASSKDEVTSARSDAAVLRKEMQILSDRMEQRGTSDNSHYKELAKLQADLGAQKRKTETLEREMMNLEVTLEDLTLDKEQLLEEKEALEDRLDELRLDAETAQMEVEELKMELDDARQSSVDYGGEQNGDGDAKDMASALSTQNARLREALIRLREQTQVEKMELMRQVRDAEKDAENGRALLKEVESLRAARTNQDEQINDLKDMVEQGAAFEQMVEDLSDRLFSLEEENAALNTVVREMEEAAELTAEMEEVQAEELKALSRDLEGRDAVIHNLEEAIKIQRRREDDFLRTVGNYRNTVATLSQEKQALVELLQGGEGEKSDLVAASQGALARASQLVSDAASARSREAVAVLDSIDKMIYKDLASRLESLLPQNVAGLEVAAIKGELLASKVINRGSKILESISSSFVKATQPALRVTVENVHFETVKFTLSDDLRQKATSMLYTADFAHTVVEASSSLLRLVAASIWPDFLSLEASADLSSMLGHSVGNLDLVMGDILKSMKEEGGLSPEHANIGALQQTVIATMQSLRSDIERDDGVVLSNTWTPPGWELLKDATMFKFTCRGVAAAFSIVVDEMGGDSTPPVIAILHNKFDKAATQAQAACLRLCSLNVNDEKLVAELSALAVECKEASLAAFEAVKHSLLQNGDLSTSNAAAASLLQTLAKFASAVRSANLTPSEKGERYHALSVEATESWVNLTTLCRTVRSIDGDEDDVNHMMRARAVEFRLAKALQNETELTLANIRVGTLEKTLATKSKEVMLQTARLSELEKEMAKGGAHVSRTIDLKASDEFERLSEENRVLHDAMQHWQTKAEEYEAALRDFKSPSGKGSKNRTPVRGFSSVSNLTTQGQTVVDGRHEDVSLLEATLFRPVLQHVLRDASRWRAAAIASTLQDLPPLYTPPLRTSLEQAENAANSLLELNSALSNARLTKAACTVVDLTNTKKSPRAQLRESYFKRVAASERLHSIVTRCNSMAV